MTLNYKLLLFIGLGVAVTIAVVIAVSKNGSEQPTLSSNINTDGTAPKDQTVMEDKAMVEAGQPQAGSGSYKDYSVATVASEFAAGNKVVLFFHAPWCPFCRAADAVFRTRTNDIPAKVSVLKTDYDSSAELKQKYGVTYQHTFVQIDAQGDQISKWNGGDIDNLKRYLK